MTQIVRPQNNILNMPPIYSSGITFNGKLTVAWQKWFASIFYTYTQTFRTYVLGSVDSNSQTQVSIPVLPGFSTDQINALKSVDDGAILYNTDTFKVNVRENGIWVEIT